MCKSDYHIHPLNHRYWKTPPAELKNLALTEDDRFWVRNVVEWCVYERNLHSIALTDHDMTQSSLYAQQYAKENFLNLHIVVGAECEVSVPGFPPDKNWAHILCYGTHVLPDYSHNTPLPEFVDAARVLGAYLVLAHPVMYPHVFDKYHSLFDGYEEQSGVTPVFRPSTSLPVTLRKFHNSDFHYQHDLPCRSDPRLWTNHFVLDV